MSIPSGFLFISLSSCCWSSLSGSGSSLGTSQKKEKGDKSKIMIMIVMTNYDDYDAHHHQDHKMMIYQEVPLPGS